ncbi:MAG: MFS transporter [archaeon]|jgi:MFS family permease
MPAFLDKIKSYPVPLQRSIIEGMVASLMFGGGMIFVVPFAVFLGANNFEVGLLSALPALFAAWVQLGAMKLVEIYKKRSPILVTTVFLQAVSWLLIALIPFIFPQDQIMWLIIITTIGTVIGSIGGPLWQSLMRSLTPQEILGEYFGVRNSLTGLIVFLMMLGSGLLLQIIQPSLMLYAFCTIFIISFIGRLLSAVTFVKIEDPQIVLDTTDKTNFFTFVNKLREGNFGYFVLFGTLLTFALAMIGPFFSVYLLNDLGLKNDYFLYTIIISSSAIASLISMPYWGKVLDKFGTIKLLKVTGIFAVFFPLTIIFVRDPYWLIFTELLSGVIFSGFNLGLANFIYESFKAEKIIKYASFQAVLFGTATFVGIMLSGYIQTMNISAGVFTSSFYAVCGLSIIFRFVFYSILIYKIKEVRNIEHVSDEHLMFNVLTFVPLRESINSDIALLLYATESELTKATQNTLKTIEFAGNVGKEETKKMASNVKNSAKRVTHITKEGIEVVEYVAESGIKRIKRVTSNGLIRAKNEIEKRKNKGFF